MGKENIMSGSYQRTAERNFDAFVIYRIRVRIVVSFHYPKNRRNRFCNFHKSCNVFNSVPAENHPVAFTSKFLHDGFKTVEIPVGIRHYKKPCLFHICKAINGFLSSDEICQVVLLKCIQKSLRSFNYKMVSGLDS